MENNCCQFGSFGDGHRCAKQPGAGVELDARTSVLQTPHEPKGKPGRPKGFDGTRSRMPSALAQKFRACGLDWQADFAEAIKNNKRERIKLWLKLLPYMITTSKKTKVSKWKGRASNAAIVALEAMEREV